MTVDPSSPRRPDAPPSRTPLLPNFPADLDPSPVSPERGPAHAGRSAPSPREAALRTDSSPFPAPLPQSLAGERVLAAGKLGGMSRREARICIESAGGTWADRFDSGVTLVVVGEDGVPLADGGHLPEHLGPQVQQALARNQARLCPESALWQRIGLMELEQHVHRLYTPAMLASLLGISVAVIRRWHRRGLLRPLREVRRLPYFDFQEVTTAKRLAELVAGGASPHLLERNLELLAGWLPTVERPLAQLSVLVEGKQLLLRQGDGLLEPGGQRRFDFDSPHPSQPNLPGDEDESPSIRAAAPLGVRTAFEIGEAHADLEVDLDDLDFAPRALAETGPAAGTSSSSNKADASVPTADELADLAVDLEDQGELKAAAETYRAAMAAGGPQAHICFALAEVLYRLGDLAGARERYYTALELDEDYVEARCNLGCVLTEQGEPTLAAAAFQGALKYHPDYPDPHFHLAQLLHQQGRIEAALPHWERFLTLAPNSPWADQARIRLGLPPREPPLGGRG